MVQVWVRATGNQLTAMHACFYYIPFSVVFWIFGFYWKVCKELCSCFFILGASVFFFAWWKIIIVVLLIFFLVEVTILFSSQAENVNIHRRSKRNLPAPTCYSWRSCCISRALHFIFFLELGGRMCNIMMQKHARRFKNLQCKKMGPKVQKVQKAKKNVQVAENLGSRNQIVDCSGLMHYFLHYFPRDFHFT